MMRFFKSLNNFNKLIIINNFPDERLQDILINIAIKKNL